MQATNKYGDRHNLAYLVNVYNNPNVINWFRKNGSSCNDNDYALSCMLQWIFRSAVRNKEEIHIFMPASRMRELLQKFLKFGSIK